MEQLTKYLVSIGGIAGITLLLFKVFYEFGKNSTKQKLQKIYDRKRYEKIAAILETEKWLDSLNFKSLRDLLRKKK
tara:strand:- start:23479 stop:23706 length:228 start_codon:yes stop_codon:yes gene_type:complete